jgi:hypothetical protein
MAERLATRLARLSEEDLRALKTELDTVENLHEIGRKIDEDGGHVELRRSGKTRRSIPLEEADERDLIGHILWKVERFDYCSAAERIAVEALIRSHRKLADVELIHSSA